MRNSLNHHCIPNAQHRASHRKGSQHYYLLNESSETSVLGCTGGSTASFASLILQRAKNTGCLNWMQKMETMTKKTDKLIPVTVGKK